jgi:hypothetical protein
LHVLFSSTSLAFDIPGAFFPSEIQSLEAFEPCPVMPLTNYNTSEFLKHTTYPENVWSATCT